MHIELLSSAGPNGWPDPGCRCASCGRLRAAGVRFEPARVLVDGVPLEECSRWEVPGGHDVRAPGGERILVAEGPGARPEPVTETAYDAVLLDLAGHPEHLGLLRTTGAATALTQVHAVHNDHRLATPAELDRRLGWWLRPRESTYRTLLLGGSRSGKSAEAELRLLTHPHVTYAATSTVGGGDPEWTARIDAHRARRPHWWRTVETTDVAEVLRTSAGAVLVDGIGGWLAAAMDEPAALASRMDELIAAWRSTEACVIAVSDEVGLSLVPTTPVGRAFRDALGSLNQRLAAESEETALVVAGRVVELP